jgi:hypothetical protein
MPKIAVEIEYDWPDDPYWMNPDNVALCLAKACKNTRFKVRWAANGDPWEGRPPWARYENDEPYEHPPTMDDGACDAK